MAGFFVDHDRPYLIPIILINAMNITAILKLQDNQTAWQKICKLN